MKTGRLSATLLAMLLAAGCAGTPAPRDDVRIDGRSAATAEASFQAMLRMLSMEERQQLVAAVMMLNFEGVRSATEVMADPALRSPSIARIRARVDGLSADEIIALASENPSVEIEVEPGPGRPR